MKIGVIRRILKEELKGGNVPGWVDNFLIVINQFIDTVTTALRANLSFDDNFSCSVHEIELFHGVDQVINPNTKKRVKGLIVTNAEGQYIDSYGFIRNQNGTISVRVEFVGGSSTTKAMCRLIIELG